MSALQVFRDPKLGDGFYVVSRTTPGGWQLHQGTQRPFDSRSDARRYGSGLGGTWYVGQATAGVLTVVIP